jgi:hypothetical protein
MESLAYVVMAMLLAQVLLGLVSVTFSILNRVLNKFKTTSQVLLGLLAIEMVWGFTIAPAFGYIALTLLAISAAVRFVKF